VKRPTSRTTRPKGGAETRAKFYLTYPSKLIKEPLIYWAGHKFPVVTNIRSASVNEEIGIIALELDGTPDAIEAAVAWFREKGVTVEPIEKNVIE
jgi:ABC-type methionine transport system ATPase subunit